ncbi:MAG: purine-binding chemotaxis protein CheW [Gemmatimonadaceae bacterium]|nr:purine-binding chemotaxis protein CheW [Gemmatimonadaceae bacterium]MDQ3517002.1 chemotaxis protein CheW [Gemmatimonadota bacterium]
MSAAALRQLVTFRLGADHFAADIYAVERVLRYEQPTAIPNTPRWIEGVIDYQNEVVPVISLRRRFELELVEAKLETRILVFNTSQGWIGAVVDAVLEVITVAAEQLAPPPKLFRGLSAEYLLGLVRREKRLVVCLDVTRLLTAEEQMALQDVKTESLAKA